MSCNSDWRRQGGSKNVPSGIYTKSSLKWWGLIGKCSTISLFYLYFVGIQVRLGSKRGSGVVQLAIAGLYVLAFAFGISRALPITCIVSHTYWVLIAEYWIEISLLFLPSSFCCLHYPGLIIFHGFFQFFCAFTLPVARLVVSYVQENHNVSTKLI